MGNNFSGKWAILWLGRTWGPFEKREQADRLKEHLRRNTKAPQQIEVFPMLAPNYFYDLVKDYEKND